MTPSPEPNPAAPAPAAAAPAAAPAAPAIPPAAPQPSALERIGDADATLSMAQARAAASILGQTPGLTPDQAIVLARHQHVGLFVAGKPPESPPAAPPVANPAVAPTRGVPTPPAPVLTAKQQAERDSFEAVKELIVNDHNLNDAGRHALAVKAITARRVMHDLPNTIDSGARYRKP